MNRSATYHIANVQASTVFIIDDDAGPTITNDAESVVTRVLSNYPAHRILYRDTDGAWSELRHDSHRFTAFAPLSPQDHIQFAKILGTSPCP